MRHLASVYSYRLGLDFWPPVPSARVCSGSLQSSGSEVRIRIPKP